MRWALLGVGVAVVAAAVLALVLRDDARPTTGVPGYRSTAPKAGATLRYPETWRPVPRAQLSDGSPGLAWVARGPRGSGPCPQPLMLLRASAAAGGALGEAVVLYNRFANARHPGRRVVVERPQRVPGAARAVLLVAEYPVAASRRKTVSRGRVVRTFDLFVETRSGGAQHLFAYGCPTDLPARFLDIAVLSLRTS